MFFSPKMIRVLLWNKSFKLQDEGIEIWISLCPVQKKRKKTDIKMQLRQY